VVPFFVTTLSSLKVILCLLLYSAKSAINKNFVLICRFKTELPVAEIERLVDDYQVLSKEKLLSELSVLSSDEILSKKKTAHELLAGLLEGELSSTLSESTKLFQMAQLISTEGNTRFKHSITRTIST
jgi:hypothetical protein